MEMSFCSHGFYIQASQQDLWSDKKKRRRSKEIEGCSFTHSRLDKDLKSEFMKICYVSFRCELDGDEIYEKVWGKKNFSSFLNITHLTYTTSSSPLLILNQTKRKTISSVNKSFCIQFFNLLRIHRFWLCSFSTRSACWYGTF